MSPPPPHCWVPVKRVCVCASFGRWGGGWLQLLPVSSKNHTAAIWMRLRLHSVAALLQPASAEPLQTGLALRAPAPAFCSGARSSVSRLSAAEDQRDSSGPGHSTCQHAGVCMSVCVCVCAHCLCHQNSLDGAVLTRGFQCGQIPLWCVGPLISLCLASWVDYKIIRGMFIAALWTCRNTSNKNI